VLSSKPGSKRALVQVATVRLKVLVAVINTVVVAVSGTSRWVRTVVVVEIVVTADTVSIRDAMAVDGIIETVVVVVLEVDCGIVRQEQAVEIAANANFSKTGETD
jgi:hypothetical protein